MHHANALRSAGGDEQLVSCLEKGDRSGVADPKQAAMLDYAEKLTRTPAAMREADVVALRELGWSDSAILDMAQVTAYFGWVNRLADGLGVQLEQGSA